MKSHSLCIIGATLLIVAISCNLGSVNKKELYSNLNEKESQSADFLLENARHYYTTDNADLLDFYPYLDSLSLTDVSFHEEKKLLENFFQTHRSAPTRYIPDMRQLTAEYLNRNIKSAFQFYGQSWNSHLSDSAFFEYVLPYRIGDEYLEDWRSGAIFFFSRTAS